MSGHSKWASIKHSKGKADKQRSKIFSKLSKEISVAAKLGDKDPVMNPRLRSAIQAARSANMPKDNIERAISKGSGEGDDFNLEEVTYEGYGPGGVAILIESMTDNRNRTVAEVRHALTKFGGNLGAEGSVSYLFKQTGLITVSGIEDEDKIVETAIELGAEDIEINDDGSIEIMTSPNDLVDIKDALSNEEINIDIAEVTMKAATDVSINLKHAQSMMKLLDMLDDLDDIQTVHSNAEISNDILEQLN